MNVTLTLEQLVELGNRVAQLNEEANGLTMQLRNAEEDASYWQSKYNDASNEAQQLDRSLQEAYATSNALRQQLAGYLFGDPDKQAIADAAVAAAKMGAIGWVESIKQVRTAFGCGLKEAKEYAEARWPDRVKPG